MVQPAFCSGARTCCVGLHAGTHVHAAGFIWRLLKQAGLRLAYGLVRSAVRGCSDGAWHSSEQSLFSAIMPKRQHLSRGKALGTVPQLSRSGY